MKVKVLYLLILPILVVTGVANAAEIYNKDGNKLDLIGKADGLYYFSNDKKNINGDHTYMQIGLKGENQINDQITAYGKWEYQIQSNIFENENNSWTRVAFVGVKFGDTSSLDYGRNYGVVYDVTSWTDLLPEFSSGTYGSDNFMQQRGKGFVTYRNENFFSLVDGLKFALQYQSKNNGTRGEGKVKDAHKSLKENGDGVAGSVIYDLGDGFVIGSAISNSKRTNIQNSMNFGTGNRAETYTGGLKYDMNNVYLATQYTQTHNATRVGELGWANKAYNFEVVAQYQFDFGLRPSIAYLQSKGKDLEQGYGDKDLAKYVDIGTIYSFNKDISTYIDYKINLLDDSAFTQKAGITTDDVIALGLTYRF